MELTTQAEIHLKKPAGVVFDFATACESFPKMLLSFGPIPGIAKAEMIDGADLRAGALRRVTMSDGSIVDEEILAFDPPERHRYRWMKPPAPPFSLVVRGGEGDWCFTPEGDGTRVVWSYRFELTSPLALPLVLVMRALFRRWMQRGLVRLRAELGG